MVGAIAQDLRTPLTHLALRLDDLPAPLNAKVHADIDKMKSMISAALEFIRDRSLTLPRERLDLRLLVERVVNDLAGLGHDAALQAGGPVTIEVVPLARRRLVSNLFENALNYGQRARAVWWWTRHAARWRLMMMDRGSRSRCSNRSSSRSVASRAPATGTPAASESACPPCVP